MGEDLPTQSQVDEDTHSASQPEQAQAANRGPSSKGDRSDSNASTESSNGPDTPSSTEFNPRTHREPTLPALAQLNRKLSKSASQTSRSGAAASKKPPAARKPRAKSTVGANTGAPATKSKKATAPPKQKAPKAPKATTTTTKTAPKKRVIQKKNGKDASPPQTIAEAQTRGWVR